MSFSLFESFFENEYKRENGKVLMEAIQKAKSERPKPELYFHFHLFDLKIDLKEDLVVIIDNFCPSVFGQQKMELGRFVGLLNRRMG